MTKAGLFAHFFVIEVFERRIDHREGASIRGVFYHLKKDAEKKGGCFGRILMVEYNCASLRDD